MSVPTYYDVTMIAPLYCTLYLVIIYCVVVHVVIVYLHYSDRPLNEQVFWAAVNGHTEEVVRLLGERADVNWQSENGWTALHAACINNHQMLSILVNSEHVNLNIKDRDKNTPLHFACSEGTFECVHLLLGAGCDSGWYV